MRRSSTVGLVLSVLVLAGAVGCSVSLGAAPGAAPAGSTPAARGPRRAPGAPGQPYAEETELNPRVTPPSPHVVAAPGLPPVTAPAGFLDPAGARERAFDIVDKRLHGGQLTLTAIRPSGSRWVLEFRGDGRVITFTEGPGRPPDRWHEASHVALVEHVAVELDGATGELYSLGLNGQPDAPGERQEHLEHYRGRILLGGQQTRLRLERPDGGTTAPRDLTVWVDASSLDRSGLDLWQLTYGTGRLLDVWGLTTADDEVVAARLSLAEPPDHSLPEHDLFQGVPLHPDARPAHGLYQDRAVYLVAGSNWEQVRDWYLTQMPRYGWALQTGEKGEYRWSFATAAGLHAEIRLRDHPDYTELTIIPDSLAK